MDEGETRRVRCRCSVRHSTKLERMLARGVAYRAGEKRKAGGLPAAYCSGSHHAVPVLILSGSLGISV